MAPKPLVTIVLFLTLVSACAHHHRAGAEVLQALKEHEAWLSQLPSCSQPALSKATGVADLGLTGDDSPVVVRGLLMLGTVSSLNDKGCPEDKDVCCTGSFVHWVAVAPPAAVGRLPSREVRVQLTAEKEDMGVGAPDCEVGDLRARARQTEVVIVGILTARGQMIVDATVCLVAATQ